MVKVYSIVHLEQIQQRNYFLLKQIYCPLGFLYSLFRNEPGTLKCSTNLTDIYPMANRQWSNVILFSMWNTRRFYLECSKRKLHRLSIPHCEAYLQYHPYPTSSYFPKHSPRLHFLHPIAPPNAPMLPLTRVHAHAIYPPSTDQSACPCCIPPFH